MAGKTSTEGKSKSKKARAASEARKASMAADSGVDSADESKEAANADTASQQESDTTSDTTRKNNAAEESSTLPDDKENFRTLEELKLKASSDSDILLTSRSNRSGHSTARSDFPVHLKDISDFMRDRHKMTLSNSLFQAVIKGRLHRVKFLLEREADVNAGNDYGFSPLVAALHVDNEGRRVKMFRFLLRHGANPKTCDSSHLRPVLSWAAMLGRAEEAKVLLEELCGDVNLTLGDREGLTPLHHAAQSGDLATLRLLISVYRKYGITVDQVDKMGLTPYLHAIRLGLHEVAEVLVKEGFASPGQADHFTFRSSSDWSKIGMLEREMEKQRNARHLINKARMEGRVNKVRELQGGRNVRIPPIEMPTSAARRRRPEQQRVSGQDMDSLFQGVPVLCAERSTPDLARARMRCTQPINFRPGDGSRLTRVSFKANRRVLDVRDGLGSQRLELPARSQYHAPASYPDTMGEFKAAMSLLQMTSHDRGHTPHIFHHSQFDSSKAREYPSLLGGISTLMEILSQEQSTSFRRPVPPPKPEALRPAKAEKPKVSSLAMTFQRSRLKKSPRLDGRRSRTNSPATRKDRRRSGSNKEARKQSRLAVPTVSG